MHGGGRKVMKEGCWWDGCWECFRSVEIRCCRFARLGLAVEDIS